MMGHDGPLFAKSVKRRKFYLELFLSAFSFTLVDDGSVVILLHFAFPNIASE